MASGNGLAEIVEALEKGRRLQRGAWVRVVELSRKWALLKTQGVMIDHHGCRVTYNERDAKSRLEMVRWELDQAIEAAFAEDAHLGATMSEHLG